MNRQHGRLGRAGAATVLVVTTPLPFVIFRALEWVLDCIPASSIPSVAEVLKRLFDFAFAISLFYPIFAFLLASILIITDARWIASKMLGGVSAVFSAAVGIILAVSYLSPPPLTYPAEVLTILDFVVGYPAAAILSLVTVVTYYRETRRRVAKPGCCAKCGYLLTGLQEPRCPQCGTPFDPSLLSEKDAARIPKPEGGDGGPTG